ncbi:Hypothetical predicted protein, partial [Paramuricea clavata]
MIMHSSGYNSGTEIANNLIQDINNSADIYDTASRLNRANDVRQNLLSQPINDFFTSGALKSFDAKLQQQESSWANATAQFQEKEQLTALGSELFSDLSSNNSLDVEKTLQKYRELSSLNEKQIQNSYVTALTQHAYSKGDPSLLAEFNKNIITDPDVQAIANKNVESIKSILWTDAVHKKQLEKEQEESRILENKFKIIAEKQKTGDVNPINYIGSPEELEYALKIKSSDIRSSINSTTRNFNADRLATRIIMESTQSNLSPTEAMDLILNSNDIGAEEKARLRSELDNLSKGADLLNVPFVAQTFTDISTKASDMIEAMDIDDAILPFHARDLRPHLRTVFYNTISNDMYAHYKEHGNMPTGKSLRDIVNNVGTRVSGELDRLEKLSEKATQTRRTDRNAVIEKSNLTADDLIQGTASYPYKVNSVSEASDLPTQRATYSTHTNYHTNYHAMNTNEIETIATPEEEKEEVTTIATPEEEEKVIATPVAEEVNTAETNNSLVAYQSKIPAKTTQDGLFSDNEFIEASKITYSRLYGKDFIGSDSEAVSWGKSYAADQLYSLTDIGKTLSSQPDTWATFEKEAYLYLTKAYGNTDFSVRGSWEFVKSFATDWGGWGMFWATTALTPETIGIAGFLAREATIGGIIASVHNVMQQNISVSFGLQESVSTSELVVSGAEGAVGGALLAGTGRAVQRGYRKLFPRKDIPNPYKIQIIADDVANQSAGRYTPQQINILAENLVEQLYKLSAEEFENELKNRLVGGSLTANEREVVDRALKIYQEVAFDEFQKAIIRSRMTNVDANTIRGGMLDAWLEESLSETVAKFKLVTEANQNTKRFSGSMIEGRKQQVLNFLENYPKLKDIFTKT